MQCSDQSSTLPALGRYAVGQLLFCKILPYLSHIIGQECVLDSYSGVKFELCALAVATIRGQKCGLFDVVAFLCGTSLLSRF